MINIARENNCSTYFIKPDPTIFWDQIVKVNIIVFKNSQNPKLSTTDKLSLKQLDFVGIFNLIDHYEDPLNFIKEILKYSKSIGIISQNVTSGFPIQHHNALSDKW